MKPIYIVIYLCLLACSVQFCQAKCAYYVMANNTPVKTDRQPFLIQNYVSCPEYNGQMGCCDQNNDHSQTDSYIEIDGVFGSQGDGCDLCAINLKRFWCQYACSPRQSQFLDVDDGYISVPDPQKPGNQVIVQKLKVTIEAQTACDLYNSCKRVSFVSAVSAMGSPAGFLTFQGHNAVDNALQYIQVGFSYNKSGSLWFSDQAQAQTGKKLSPCNYKTDSAQIHGFPFHKNCTCNNCEDSCQNTNGGFVYTQASILQGFNWELVGITYLSVAVITGIVTAIRYKNKYKLD